MKTLAAVLYETNKPLRIEELILPDLSAGQVLVKIKYTGICHSQLNEIRGLKGEDEFLPHTLGHEGAGIVEEIGPGVEKVKPGDHVVLTWIKGSGADVNTAKYKRNDGSLVNSGAISTFLTKAVISENRLVKISDKMPLMEASLLGCAIPTGAGIIINTAKVSQGESIAIFGIGGIGLSALLAAKMNDASAIIAVDVQDDKLEKAIKLGATHTINSLKQDVLARIFEITNKRGVDYAVESAGRKETMEKAFQSVRDNGGLCIIAGNLPQGEQISINPFDLIRGKKIIGTWGGETKPDKDIPVYIDLFLSGKLNLKSMISKIYTLDKINEMLDFFEKGEMGRILIDMVKE